jgi:hypothetical protein
MYSEDSLQQRLNYESSLNSSFSKTRIFKTDGGKPAIAVCLVTYISHH